MISVVDYGVANLGSLLNMMRRLEIATELASTPEALARAEKIILPGVGSFDHGMSALAERNLVDVLKRKASDDKVPLLGICLGMQILGHGSEEGALPGLGLIDAHARRFRFAAGSKLKVPHMGWSSLNLRRQSPLVDALGDRARFYFVHSYHLECGVADDVLATADHGVEFVSMVQRGNVYGAQFHPEKSHRFGMALLKNFARV